MIRRQTSKSNTEIANVINNYFTFKFSQHINPEDRGLQVGYRNKDNLMLSTKLTPNVKTQTGIKVSIENGILSASLYGKRRHEGAEGATIISDKVGFQSEEC